MPDFGARKRLRQCLDLCTTALRQSAGDQSHVLTELRRKLTMLLEDPEALGAPVTAPSEGLVQYVGPVKGWGVILILRLPGGYHLVLAGLDRATVGIGQSVAAGSPVGWMTDGRQSPSELYLEVRERGVPVDPAKWLGNKTE